MQATVLCLAIASFWLGWPIDSVIAETLKPLNQHELDAAASEMRARIKRFDEELKRTQSKLKELQARDPLPKGVAGAGDVSPKIVNGVLTAAYPTIGVLLKGEDSESGKLQCSGTMIGCSGFLTAAHCVATDPEPTHYKVFLQHGGIFDVAKISYQKDLYSFPNADVAVVTLAKPVSGITPSLINTRRAVPSNTAGIIVGFGRSGGLNRDYGLKQLGHVRTRKCGDGLSNANLVCWDFNDPIGTPGENSNTCNGDSGGPLFVEFTPDGKSLVAGVTSGGRNETCLAKDHSYDASVFQYQSWITTTCGNDINNLACGSLPQVGSSGATINAYDGFLNGQRPSESLELVVPPGMLLLRVAMNAQDDGDGTNDFDLYVRLGSPPTPQVSDCRQDGSGQFAFCEFKQPKDGTWHILVTRKKGVEKYQVVATIFQ